MDVAMKRNGEAEAQQNRHSRDGRAMARKRVGAIQPRRICQQARRAGGALIPPAGFVSAPHSVSVEEP